MIFGCKPVLQTGRLPNRKDLLTLKQSFLCTSVSSFEIYHGGLRPLKLPVNRHHIASSSLLGKMLGLLLPLSLKVCNLLLEKCSVLLPSAISLSCNCTDAVSL